MSRRAIDDNPCDSWRALYPFESHWLEVAERADALPRRSGPARRASRTAATTLLFVHGNPTWSFHWRNLIQPLRVAISLRRAGSLGLRLQRQAAVACCSSPITSTIWHRSSSGSICSGSRSSLRIGAARSASARCCGCRSGWSGSCCSTRARFRRLTFPGEFARAAFRCSGDWPSKAADSFNRAALRMTLARATSTRPGVAAAYLAPYNIVGQSPRRVRLRQRHSQRPRASDLADARRHRATVADARRSAGAAWSGACATGASGPIAWSDLSGLAASRGASPRRRRPLGAGRRAGRSGAARRRIPGTDRRRSYGIAAGRQVGSEPSSMAESYRVRIAKAEHVFSAAHFITYEGHCERLHGHNYRVAAEDRRAAQRRIISSSIFSPSAMRSARSSPGSITMCCCRPSTAQLVVVEVGDEVTVAFDRSPLDLSARRLPAAAGGQHDGRAAGRLHRPRAQAGTRRPLRARRAAAPRRTRRMRRPTGDLGIAGLKLAANSAQPAVFLKPPQSAGRYLQLVAACALHVASPLTLL